jgi:hypothetical protein
MSLIIIENAAELAPSLREREAQQSLQVLIHSMYTIIIING